MERGSTKHGPGHDEAIKKRTEPIERGGPAGSRADEGRVEEGWADDEAVSDVRPMADSVELRSDIARYVDRVIFPAGRDQLVEDAASRHAPTAVLESLQMLPADRSFESVEQIWQALGGEPERRF
jgi:hypothetical protein